MERKDEKLTRWKESWFAGSHVLLWLPDHLLSPPVRHVSPSLCNTIGVGYKEKLDAHVL